MVNIVYRHYQDGDDEGCAKVYTRAFQMDLFGHLQDAHFWHWRYPLDPDFEPEMIQIAEDTDNNRIVGMICANRIEKSVINGTEYLVGDINDVSTDPRYVRRGIGKELMEMAIDYMESRGCDYSILAADPRGFPRSRIYLKMGYVDVDKDYANICFPNFLRFTKHIPAVLGLTPVINTLNYLPKIINRLRIKFTSFFKDFSYEIIYNDKHWEMMDAINRIFPKYYEGFYPYSKKQYRWMRIDTPDKERVPTYVAIRNKGEIIGGATLTDTHYANLSLKLKFTFSIANQIFLDKSIFANKRDLHFGYLYLLDKIMKATVRRRKGILFHHCSQHDYDLKRAFRSTGCIQAPASTLMLKVLNKNLSIPKFKNPYYVPTHVSIGFP